MALTIEEAVQQMKAFTTKLFSDNPGLADSIRVQFGKNHTEVCSFTVHVVPPGPGGKNNGVFIGR